jgi:AraC-like DNA-binding protein
VPHAEFQPTAALRPWVECFWTRTRDAAPAGGVHRILPDGCADFVFDLASGAALAVGTMTKPLVIAAGNEEFIGVRFRPGRAAAFLRIPLAEVTDARVRLGDVWRDAPEEPTLPALERALLQRLAPDRDPRVDAAVDSIVRGATRIDDLEREIGISRQHLARQFQHHVGVSPKTFVRVMRFRRVVDRLPAGAAVDWAGVAAEHGYYDQSHLIEDFRELAGSTPGEFFTAAG